MRRTFLAVVLLASVTSLLRAHDLFLKLADYFIAPNRSVKVAVLNGTFSTSENFITRDRLRDVSLVGGGARTVIDTSAWTPAPGGKSGFVTAKVTKPGTYVLGASTLPRELKLPAKDFNAYLKDEGLGDVLAQRERDGELGLSSNERYHKHVKAIFQVGDQRTEDYATELGYPAEIVPSQNPYALKVGDKLTVRCLLGGTAAANVVVIAGGRQGDGSRLPVQTVRADANGTASITLTAPGIWYVKFIRMEKAPHDGLTHESRWATLTFGVK
ncbi:MAG: DUF4198 domain-containing protein [Gemmatimonadaceae bacterium]